MRRIILGLFLALGFTTAHAQVTNPLTNAMRIGTAGDCATTACTSGTRQLCRNSTTDEALYACDTGTGFYAAAVASVAITGGADTRVLYQDGSVVAGDAGMTFNDATDALSVFTLLVTGNGLSVTGGIDVATGGIDISAGQSVGLEGGAGDTHVVRTTATASLDSYLDGTLGWSINGGMLQPPVCPDPLTQFGFCAINGRVAIYDSSGFFYMNGEAVVR